MDKYSFSSFGYTKEIPDYNMYLGEIIPQLILLQRVPPRPTNVEPHIHIVPSSWAPGYLSMSFYCPENLQTWSHPHKFILSFNKNLVNDFYVPGQF